MLLVALALVATSAAQPAAQSYGCQHPPQSAMPFCDASLPTEARIDDMLGRLRTAREAAEGALVQAVAQVDVVVEVEGTSPLI